MDYNVRILKRDLEESLEISNKRKLIENKYDRLRKKDFEVRLEYRKMKTTDEDFINIRSQVETNEQLPTDEQTMQRWDSQKKNY